jgi:dolichol-phosphate mannosyltransferase
MTFNFLLNNAVTFRDRRLQGWGLMKGLFVFYTACTIGALINVSLAHSLFQSHVSWYVAGFCGAVIGSIWNYGASTVLTWRRGRMIGES